MKTLSGLVWAMVAVVVLSGACLADNATAATTVHKYDSFGFNVAVPSGAERIALSSMAEIDLSEAYSTNGLACIVQATSNVQPRTMSAKALIGMITQIITTIAAKDPSLQCHGISGTTAQGVQAQGFGVMVTEKAGGRGVKIPTEVAQLFGSSIYESAVLVPLNDTPAVLGVLAVLGPANRQSDADALLQQMIQSFTITDPSAAAKHSGYKITAKAKNQAAAAPLKMTPLNTLTKGQIELVGMIKSIDAENKSLDMLVSQAVSFGGSGAVLSPPKLKRVYFKTVQDFVKEGAVIVVVADDTGPGKSVTAQKMTPLDMSKLGL